MLCAEWDGNFLECVMLHLMYVQKEVEGRSVATVFSDLKVFTIWLHSFLSIHDEHLSDSLYNVFGLGF